MSFNHIAWAISAKVRTSTQRLVLLAIAFHSIDGGYIATRRTIAEITLINPDTVGRIIKQLVGLDLIHVRQRFDDKTGARLSNHYFLKGVEPL
jgi:DNA-binding MarR family transcriptional regulator